MISPAHVDAGVDVGFEGWQAEIGCAAMLEGDGRSFAEVKEERIGCKADPGVPSEFCAA